MMQKCKLSRRYLATIGSSGDIWGSRVNIPFASHNCIAFLKRRFVRTHPHCSTLFRIAWRGNSNRWHTCGLTAEKNLMAGSESCNWRKSKRENWHSVANRVAGREGSTASCQAGRRSDKQGLFPGWRCGDQSKTGQESSGKFHDWQNKVSILYRIPVNRGEVKVQAEKWSELREHLRKEIPCILSFVS